MSTVTRLVPKDVVEAANSSAKVLQDAIDMRPDTVIVFCFVDGVIHIKASTIRSNIELMGALEAAKQQIWSNA